MARTWFAALVLVAASFAASSAAAQVEVIVGGPTPAPVAHKPSHHHHPSGAPHHSAVGQSPDGASRSRAIVAYALRFLGVPYVWGGQSTLGFDCSGYTWYVYRTFGYAIPRTADAQFAAGRPVSTPLAGDLVFFQTYDYGASHVGIYLGAGRLVSAIAGSVQVSSFGEAYFAMRYVGARRFAALD
jgi:cell wall-associated NlpC family hydrolase